MPINNFTFSKDWNNPSDFPATVSNATEARRNIQLLHDEMKDFINEVLLQHFNTLVDSNLLKPKAEGGFSDVELATELVSSDSQVPTSKAIFDKIAELGGGDMLKDVYDPGNVIASDPQGRGIAGLVSDSVDEKFTGYAKASAVVSVSLKDNEWIGSGSAYNVAPFTQTVTVSGVTASNNIVVAYGSSISEAAETDANKCRVRATAQGANSVTFTASKGKPVNAIPISVLILG